MLNNSARVLLRHSNRETVEVKCMTGDVVSFQQGQLLCSAVSAGGGFVGAAQTIHVWVREQGWPDDLFPQTLFPANNANFDYVVWPEQSEPFLCKGNRR